MTYVVYVYNVNAGGAYYITNASFPGYAFDNDVSNGYPGYYTVGVGSNQNFHATAPGFHPGNPINTDAVDPNSYYFTVGLVPITRDIPQPPQELMEKAKQATTSPGTFPPIMSAWLTNKGTGRCMAVWEVLEGGHRIIIQADNYKQTLQKNADRRFYFKPWVDQAGTTYYGLLPEEHYYPPNYVTCVYVSADCAAGVKLLEFEQYNPGWDNMSFRFDPQGDGSFKIVPKSCVNEGKDICFGVVDNNPIPDSRIQLVDWTGSDRQKWIPYG